VYRLPYRTEQVLANRVAMGHISQWQVDDPAVVDFISVVDCSLIGEYATVTWPSGKTLGPYLIVDCRDRSLPPYPDHLEWVLAAEFGREHWLEEYDWTQFAAMAPIIVRAAEWTPGQNHGIMQ